MLDLEALGDGLADLVLDAVQRATAPLHKQIADLQARAPAPAEKGDKGDPGEPGRDGVAPSVDDLRPLVLEAVAAAVADIPPPKDGEPGQKGDPGENAPPPSDEQVEAAVQRAFEPREGILNPVAAEVRRYLEAFPPQAGDKGDPGEPGAAGKDAAPVTGEQIAEAVAKWLEANPPAAGKDGADGKDGEKGDPGKDGLGLAGSLIDRSGNLIVTMTDGTTRDLGPVEGSDGKDGKDGVDGKDGEPGPAGFSLEDFDSEVRDGGRTLVLSFTAGDTKHTVEHQLDTMIYRGTYKAGQEYQPGDTVTCGGQTYHCNSATAERPDGGSAAWTICSRRGRDGKDADPAPMLRLIEDKFKDAEDSLMKRIEALLRSKGL